MRALVDVAVATTTAMATMAIGLLVVPVYLRALGVEAYGLIGFLALLQGMLQLLDLGLIPTISREVASASARQNYAAVQPLLTTLSRMYLAIGAVFGVVIIALSPLVAAWWLTPKNLSAATVRDVVMLIGLVIAFRWPVGFYSGALIGAHRLSLVSVANLGAGVIASIGGVAVVLLYPSILALVAWQAVIALLQLLLMRHLAWRQVGHAKEAVDMLQELRRVWRFSAGMGMITLIAVALSQFDKLLVSRLVTLEAFGFYTLASVAGKALYSLITPMYNFIAPRFTAMHATGRDDALRVAYRQWTTAFCSVFFPATMMLAVAARPLIQVWTGNVAIAAQVAPLATLIAIGSGLHSVMYFPFALQIAVGDSRTPLFINLLLVVFYIPLLTILVLSQGAYGAALAWALLFATYVPLGIWLTHRRLLSGTAGPWLLVDVGIPLAVTGILGLLAHAFLPSGDDRSWVQIVIIGFFAGVAFIINGVTVLTRFPALRTMMWSWLRPALSTLRGER